MNFSALNAHFSSSSADSLKFKEACLHRCQKGAPL